MALILGSPGSVMNRTDAMAAGIAATSGQLEKLMRVWYLGDGIGFGRYPGFGGIWEAGHSVVSLDPKERYCGCGGVGHLESIMGNRAMRLRFLDMEPEEVFANANDGRRALRGICKPVASRAGGGVGHQHPPGRSGQSSIVLGPNAEFVEPASAGPVSARDGDDEFLAK